MHAPTHTVRVSWFDFGKNVALNMILTELLVAGCLWLRQGHVHIFCVCVCVCVLCVPDIC